MLEEARRDLGVEVVACDTELRLAGIDPEVARPALDAMRSLPDAVAHRGRRGTSSRF